MLFSKKGRSNKRKGLHDAETLYPVLHVISTLKDYQKEMVRKEVESLLELSKVGSSFDGVLNEADQFQGQLHLWEVGSKGLVDPGIKPAVIDALSNVHMASPFRACSPIYWIRQRKRQ